MKRLQVTSNKLIATPAPRRPNDYSPVNRYLIQDSGGTLLWGTVPLSFPHLFIAAMAALGESVEPYPEVPPPQDDLT